MGETSVTSGNDLVKGKISYVEQEPFIFSASVRENITFGEPYDAERFENAIHYSQLERDVEIFGKGVETVIGERGVNVSGGQKARISLARAIYS